MSLVVALDIGGTFTDFVAFNLATGEVIQAKDSTTPYDLSVGIKKTLGKSGLAISSFDNFVHGSTVAIKSGVEIGLNPTISCSAGPNRWPRAAIPMKSSNGSIPLAKLSSRLMRRA